MMMMMHFEGNRDSDSKIYNKFKSENGISHEKNEKYLCSFKV